MHNFIRISFLCNIVSVYEYKHGHFFLRTWDPLLHKLGLTFSYTYVKMLFPGIMDFNKCISRGIPINGNVEVALESDGCRGTHNRVTYLEHVQAIITLTASRRGEIEVFLTSPQGTRSTLLARRVRDTSSEGFNNWAFMTTHSWGETAVGTWRLEVRNGASVCEYFS